MPHVLFLALVLLVSGCAKNQADPAEITRVFDRHSYAVCDLPRMQESLRASGPSALASFDPQAVFLPPHWRPELPARGRDHAGTGLVLWSAGGAAAVVRVFPGSPAEAAGLKAGDRILSVDGRPVAGLPEAVIGRELYGTRDGVFRFKGRSRSGGELDGSLRREFGGMPAVWGFLVPGTRTGYLRVVNFTAKAAARLKAETKALLDGGANRVIIDLRGNFGGSIEELSSALALFVPRPWPLFKAVSRHPGYCRVFSAGEAGPYAGLKALVLTDAATASRAEVFAAALREWGGAAVVGGATAGNVSVSRGFRLKNGASLRITVARLLTPAGLDLDGKGLAPDVSAGEADKGPREFPAALASSDSVLVKALQLP